MIKKNLKDMTNGWFIGDFEPSIFKTKNFEVALKRYKLGHIEKQHFHKKSTEYTLVVEGRVRMNNFILVKDEIIEVKPLDLVAFEALEDSITLVVKVPSSKSDKYVLDF